MKIFTYKDYSNYQKFLKEKGDNSTNKNVYSQLQEEKEEYHVKEHILENITINNEHDKIFRKILDDKNEALLKDDSFLSKAMLIEKISYTSNLAIYLEQIVEEVNERKDIYTKSQKELLMIIINLVLRKKLDNNKTEELIEKLKGEDDNMLAVLEMIEEENKRLLARGEKRGIKKGTKDTIQTVTKRMLKKEIPIETIMEITGLSREEVMKQQTS